MMGLLMRAASRACTSIGHGSGASLGKKFSWNDPDFRERSLTKRFVPAKARLFFGIIKTSIVAALVT